MATATSRSSAIAAPSAATFPPRVHDTAAATSEATIAKSKVARSPALNGAVINVGKKLRPVSVACCAAERCDSTPGPDQMLHGVVPEERREQRRHRRQMRHRRAAEGDTPCATRP